MSFMRRRNGPLALFWALLARSLAGYPILANGHWNDVFCVSWMTDNDPKPTWRVPVTCHSRPLLDHPVPDIA
jgi:hypothetical protein